MRRFVFIAITVFMGIGNITNAQSIVFNKIYDSNNDNNAAFDILETKDGGYFITGSSSLNGNLRLWLIKLNNLGDTLWSKKYDMTVGVDYTYSLVELQFGGFMLLGTLHDTSTTSAKAYLMKVDEQGDSLWLKQYGSTENEWGYSLAQSPDGGFVCAGWTFNTIDPNYADAWVFKTDSLGNLLWEKQFDNYGLQDNFDKVIITQDGNIVCAGVTVIDAVTGLDYVVKLNQQGDTLWTKQFGGLECGGTFDINNTQDGGFIGCGAKCVNGNQRASVYRLDSLGNIIWYNTYSPEYLDLSEFIFSFSAIHELPNGNFMAAGADYDMTYTIPGVDHATQTRMMEFNALGDSIWSKSYRYTTNGDEDYMFDMKLTSDGGFIICGYVIHSSPTKNDALVIKIDSNRCDNVPCQLSIGVAHSTKEIIEIRLYPNPTTGTLNIELENEKTSEVTLEIYNLLGKKVYNQTITQKSINLNHLNNGVYFIQLTDINKKHIVPQKLMLQK